MSAYDRSMAELTCKGCGETVLTWTRLIYNPERFVMAAENFAAEHRDCAKFKDPVRARNALRWRRLCRETAFSS